MEEHIYQIRTYLPVEFDEQETNDFIDYLFAAYLENLQNQKYQFSFTAFHMLYMSYVYKVKWFLKQQGDVAIDKSLSDFALASKGTTFNTLFDLSQMPEKTSLEKLLKSLSFHANYVDLCKNLVEVRNKCSHASGMIYFRRDKQVENYIIEELDSIIAIQKKIKPHFKTIFDEFVNQNWNVNWIDSNIKEWILKFYLSQKDIEEILKIKPDFLKDDSNNMETVYKKILYIVIVSECTKYLDYKGDYLQTSMKALMKGITKQIDIKKDQQDAEKLKTTQEIIEEKIVPILTDLSGEEAAMAQKILKLNLI